MKQLSHLVSLFLCMYALMLPAGRLCAQKKYEFRGAWIATVDNIDWPSKGNYQTDSQKVEFTRMLDMLQKAGINAAIVQIRPAADAFYPSQYEPWSEWLTGHQGRPPAPYYDPLAFMIEEVHKRGMEFHAWCNPYRAEFAINKSSISPTHITRLHPEWFLTYGTTRYFDPGNKEVQQYVVQVIRDIVSRYPIDALHFDDYFYPYRIPGREFPDDSSFARYGSGMSREDWRRSNVDSIIVQLSHAIKDGNRFCRFGISPFGVWRNQDKDPEGSATAAGQTSYDDLYANILLWLKNGWIDYVVPQIYWEFTQPHAPYQVLLDWWSKHSYGRQCYIGLGMYKAGVSAAWRDKTLLPREIDSLRRKPEVQGAVYFSAKSITHNLGGWTDSLRLHYYKYPALIPPMPWIDSTRPMQPIVTQMQSPTYANAIMLDIKKHVMSKPIKAFVVYRFDAGSSTNPAGFGYNIFRIIPATSGASVLLSDFDIRNKQVAVSCIDTNNNESELVPVEQ